jgi:4-amino-4-deoxy-L-arabinose transferase-like glycosyltransferase
MSYGLIIFLLALSTRLLNLLLQDLNIESYIFEDQVMYWEWSLKRAYLSGSEISNTLLTERMPGSFLYFELLQWITNKNLFIILFIQAILDSFTCVIISNCAYLINYKYKLYTGLFAAFSPLLIIISAQVLSDSLFLFTFTSSLYFLLKYFKFNFSNYYIVLSGLFLGLSTFTRASTFPLIFLSLPIIYFVMKSFKFKFSKISLALGLFVIVALFPVSNRLFDNIFYNNSFSLTSQTGSHAAYWMVPGVLTISENIDRDTAVNIVNKKIEDFGGLTTNPYSDSNILLNVSINILSDQNILHIAYAWLRASSVNTIVSPILIDNRVRNLKHTSFANEGNINNWLTSIFLNKNYLDYRNIIIVASILSLISIILFIMGSYILFRNDFILGVLAFLIIIYFCLITGPTLSPKYCIPYAPIIFYLQAIALEKLLSFKKQSKYAKNYK